MTITKQLLVDQIEVVQNGTVQVRMLNQITDDSTNPPTVTSIGFDRHVVVPGQDYSSEDAKVQAICSVVHTSEVIFAYQTAQEANIK